MIKHSLANAAQFSLSVAIGLVVTVSIIVVIGLCIFAIYKSSEIAEGYVSKRYNNEVGIVARIATILLLFGVLTYVASFIGFLILALI